jgi:putative ABC transport system permease protein
MSGDFWRRLRLPWLDREDIESEVEDELRFHMQMRTLELLEAGVDPAEADARVAEQFGDVAATRAGYIARRGRQLKRARLRLWIEELGQDLRFAARSLRHHGAFAATAILVLALGIGAPTTVFTLVDTIFFDRPAHVVEPHRLLRVFRSWGPGQAGGSLRNPDYLYYRENATTLSGLAAYGGRIMASYRFGSGEPDQLDLAHASDNYFDVLGVRAHIGRTFRAEENATPGTHAVAVLSYGFWSRVTGGDPEVVGSTITLNGIPFTVIGVAPEGFTGISLVEGAPEVWAPIAMYGALLRKTDTAWWERNPNYSHSWLDVVGRVADGVTHEAAQSNLVGLADALDYEGKDPEEGVMVTRQFLYRPDTESSISSLSRMLIAVVAFVLLIAASNVAVLLLSRATTRDREIGIRTAMGAGRSRLVRQLLAESCLLGALGGLLGVGLAYVSAGLAAKLIPLPLDATFTPSGPVLAAAAALSLATSLLVGLAPAIHGASTDVRTVIQEAAHRVRGGRLRGTLVVAQVGLSLVLVAGALLFGRSFWAAQSHDLGFERDGILIVGVNLQNLGYGPDEGRGFVEEALDRLSALPGARAVSTSTMVPFNGDWSTDIDAPPGSTPNAPDNQITIGLNVVGPDYFDVTGVPIVAGRPLGREDRPDAPTAAVINEALGELLWPGENPIGRVLPIGDDGGYVVVGLAADATYYELGESGRVQAYLYQAQEYQPQVNFFLRSDSDAASLAPAVRAELRAIDPTLAFGLVTTMEAVVEDEVARYEASAVLVGLFSMIALTLAAAGLYGVVSFLVSGRTREIGVRMALGADRNRVAAQVLRSALRLAAFGVALGLVGAVALRDLTEGLLFGVEPGDPLPLIGACLALLAVTVAASLGPARRATRVDPVEAIRAE